MMETFLASRTGCIVGDALIVLDRAASRYFRMVGDWPAEPCGDGTSRHTILLDWDDDAPLALETARKHRMPRVRRADGRSTDNATIRSLLRLRWLEARYAATLRRGLAAGLASLPSKPSAAADHTSIPQLVGSTWRSRRLWSARDRCLPQSLALTHALRAAGSRAQLVLGVALHPFAAHAWVQDGDRVINDTLDHAALFTPILVA